MAQARGGGATMTRSQPSVSTEQIAQQEPLFVLGPYIGLKADNEWGLDIVTWGGNYYKSVLESQDFNAVMMCLALHLQQGHNLPIKAQVPGYTSGNTTGIRGSATRTSSGRFGPASRADSTGAGGTTNRVRRVNRVQAQTSSPAPVGAGGQAAL
jgi:hypothetical protein